MLFGTFLSSIVRWWLAIMQLVVFNPALLIKSAFLWFGITFAISYIFFLMVHKGRVVHVRKNLALALVRSCWTSFLLSSVFLAFYQFIMQNMAQSAFFQRQQSVVHNLMLSESGPQSLYKHLCFMMVLLAGLFAIHNVGAMLDEWYQDYVSNRYGWCIMAVTVICLGFLWSINYVV